MLQRYMYNGIIEVGSDSKIECPNVCQMVGIGKGIIYRLPYVLFILSLY